ncbi:MAG: tetratricopeptide repeat protein [Candidatus Eisenbacteria bacterium]|uniref:Tetratricopeptide repeat protein n=1 Tax=Eiseniibacteriota bacterium TaxID=2212470 RepID=A0A956NDB9_UNCEI|nr:tetratricopeptide repeat protein [Candidatus Eisenbacteria bacterium]MCB9466319.1 tetratricopeptide repeat protein [Candidatus Eisenbacteria bacterium]
MKAAIALVVILTVTPTSAAAQAWSILCDRVDIPDSTRFSLSQSDLRLDETLHLLLDGTGLGLVLEGALSCSTQTRILDATIGEALESLAQAHDFAYRIEGGSIVVSAAETRTFRVDYLGNPEAAFWAEVQAALVAILGEEARFTVSPRAGSVTVIAPPSRVREAGKYLDELETTLSDQVHIEAKIVEVSLDKALQVGIDWTVFGNGWNDLEPNTDAGGLLQLRTTEDLGGLFQMGLLRADKLDLLIEALEQQGNLEIISRPRVAAMGNEPGIFRMSENIPYYEIQVLTAEGSQPYVQYQIGFKEAGVVLEVFAQIADDGSITLQVHPTVSSVTGFTESLPNLPPQPIIDTRETQTSVRLREEQTLVIGGMIQTLESDRVSGIPILSRIPYLGALFRRTKVEEQRRELVVLLTPRIIRDRLARSLCETGMGLRVESRWNTSDPRSILAAHEHNRALDAFAAGDRPRAVAHAERAVVLAPGRPEARNNLGYFLAQDGRIEDAEVQWMKVSGTTGRAVAWARCNLLALDAALGRNSSRLDWILEHGDSGPIRTAALVNEALRVAERGNRADAVALLARAKEETDAADLRNVIEELEQGWSHDPAGTFDGWAGPEEMARSR